MKEENRKREGNFESEITQIEVYGINNIGFSKNADLKCENRD